ncbi:hypothetical protein DMUE_2442 [Dictyocoela muelleri]|nr:hypothetical protein DMUE_2442 [Dictyocoela muelleri]
MNCWEKALFHNELNVKPEKKEIAEEQANNYEKISEHFFLEDIMPQKEYLMLDPNDVYAQYMSLEDTKTDVETSQYHTNSFSISEQNISDNIDQYSSESETQEKIITLNDPIFRLKDLKHFVFQENLYQHPYDCIKYLESVLNRKR